MKTAHVIAALAVVATAAAEPSFMRRLEDDACSEDNIAACFSEDCFANCLAGAMANPAATDEEGNPTEVGCEALVACADGEYCTAQDAGTMRMGMPSCFVVPMPACMDPCFAEDADCGCDAPDEAQEEPMSTVIMDCYEAGGSDWALLVDECGLTEGQLANLAGGGSGCFSSSTADSAVVAFASRRRTSVCSSSCMTSW
jgi:hypothetical protein